VDEGAAGAEDDWAGAEAEDEWAGAEATDEAEDGAGAEDVGFVAEAAEDEATAAVEEAAAGVEDAEPLLREVPGRGLQRFVEAPLSRLLWLRLAMEPWLFRRFRWWPPEARAFTGVAERLVVARTARDARARRLIILDAIAETAEKLRLCVIVTRSGGGKECVPEGVDSNGRRERDGR
jgi:hypothetical protein